MIRAFNDPSGKDRGRPEFNPRALLQSIERHLARSQPGPSGDKNVEAAQQLVYDAWDARTDAEEQALIFSALKLDPLNVDALIRAGEYAGLDGEAEIAYLRQVVAAGEKGLGPKAFKEFAGHFWGHIETRPYMRARQRLAEALRHVGRLDEAIAEWNAMLTLNPDDNQGIRYSLLPALLTLNQLEPARKLFEQYPGELDFNTVFAWCRVLERFLSNDLSGATDVLAIARKQNPHTQAYIKGHRRLPKKLPPAYTPGEHDEAMCFAEPLQAAWEKHPKALQWLETQKL
jgi:tetratricopeptide (TPR) repeat protein